MSLNKNLPLKIDLAKCIEAWLDKFSFKYLDIISGEIYKPLMTACEKGHLDICKWLLEKIPAAKKVLALQRVGLCKVTPLRIALKSNNQSKRGQTPPLKRCQRKLIKRIVSAN